MGSRCCAQPPASPPARHARAVVSKPHRRAMPWRAKRSKLRTIRLLLGATRYPRGRETGRGRGEEFAPPLLSSLSSLLLREARSGLDGAGVALEALEAG